MSYGSHGLLGSVYRAPIDWLWGGIGLSVALASASFAGYMLIVGPPALSADPNGYFTVFAAFDHRPQFAARRAAEAGSALPRPPIVDEALSRPPAAGTVDFDPTGSVEAPSTKPDRARSSVDLPKKPENRPGMLADFSLRDVFDGQALVESRSKLILVKRGSVLDGAGEVRSIERQNGAWVVVTTGGVIGVRSR